MVVFILIGWFYLWLVLFGYLLVVLSFIFELSLVIGDVKLR